MRGLSGIFFNFLLRKDACSFIIAFRNHLFLFRFMVKNNFFRLFLWLRMDLYVLNSRVFFGSGFSFLLPCEILDLFFHRIVILERIEQIR